jgi:hypothetical protein
MLKKPVDQKTPRAGGRNIGDPVPNRAADAGRRAEVVSQATDPVEAARNLVGQGITNPSAPTPNIFHIMVADKAGIWTKAHELYSQEQVVSAMKRLQSIPKERIAVMLNGKLLGTPEKRTRKKKQSLVQPENRFTQPSVERDAALGEK